MRKAHLRPDQLVGDHLGDHLSRSFSEAWGLAVAEDIEEEEDGGFLVRLSYQLRVGEQGVQCVQSSQPSDRKKIHERVNFN